MAKQNLQESMDACETLLRATVFRLPLPDDFILSPETWRATASRAMEQGVGALLYDAIPCLPRCNHPPRETLFALAAAANRAERGYWQKQRAYETFSLLVGKEYPMLKGLSLAALYPTPQHRVFGDIDLFTGEETETLTQLLESHGIACDKKNPRHTTFVYQGVLFEAHRWLDYWNPRKDPRQAASFPFACERRSFQALFLSEGLNYDALFFDKAITLRNMLDWALLTRQPDFDREEFNRMKKNTEVERFADAFDSHCNTVLRLTPPSPMPTVACGNFSAMFCRQRKRRSSPLLRVLLRSGKYVRYGRCYKHLYGENMFRHFYWENLKAATRSLARFLHS
ncbi:MAG: nucleotidyltransferase family protein [Bacteroidales bacterium]|nr:nucleotidyltransferase family protein [Bacteroidales bacterium]